eukprot:9887458-Heterocapsa_arctica.AAC.1
MPGGLVGRANSLERDHRMLAPLNFTCDAREQRFTQHLSQPRRPLVLLREAADGLVDGARGQRVLKVVLLNAAR